MKVILVVDDKPEIAKVITVYLSAEYEVHYMEDPIKAISWLMSGNFPSLIITDIQMPNMNGGEFLKFLKSSELFKAIPVLVLSSIEGSEERIQLLEDGAADFLLKPFNPQELKIRIKNILRGG